MQVEILTSIINELGPVGLLVAGLFVILAGPIRQMAKSLNVINHEIGDILEEIKKVTDHVARKGG